VRGEIGDIPAFAPGVPKGVGTETEFGPECPPG